MLYPYAIKTCLSCLHDYACKVLFITSMKLNAKSVMCVLCICRIFLFGVHCRRHALETVKPHHHQPHFLTSLNLNNPIKSSQNGAYSPSGIRQSPVRDLFSTPILSKVANIRQDLFRHHAWRYAALLSTVSITRPSLTTQVNLLAASHSSSSKM